MQKDIYHAMIVYVYGRNICQHNSRNQHPEGVGNYFNFKVTIIEEFSIAENWLLGIYHDFEVLKCQRFHQRVLSVGTFENFWKYREKFCFRTLIN